jgi:hypothetical protein
MTKNRSRQVDAKTSSDRLSLSLINRHAPGWLYRELVPAQDEWQLQVASAIAANAWKDFDTPAKGTSNDTDD